MATFTQASQDITPDVWAWQHEAYAQDDFKVSPRLTLYMGVRWSFFGQPTDTNGQMTNFDPAAYDPAKAPKIDPTTGRVIAGNRRLANQRHHHRRQELAYGNQIANDNYHNFAPRIGLAWDPFGTGKTSVRAGYGIYHDSTLFGIYEQNMFANPPFVASVTYTNASFNDVSAGTAGIDPLGPNATAVLAPRGTQIPAKTPYTQQWSLNIQRQLPEELCARSRLFRLQGNAPAGRRRSELGPAGRGSGRRVAPAPTATRSSPPRTGRTSTPSARTRASTHSPPSSRRSIPTITRCRRTSARASAGRA